MEEIPAARQIDDIIAKHKGWKGEILTKVRAVIRQADPAIIEEVKWKMPSLPEGRPVWTHDGIVCIAEVFKNDIKLTFFKGAFMKDSHQLFNARLNSKTDRAIAFVEGDTVPEAALADYIHEAAQINMSKAKR